MHESPTTLGSAVRLSSKRIEAGDVVLSHTVSCAVPSALRGLTTVFGMGTGVTLAAKPPTNSKEERASLGASGDRVAAAPHVPLAPARSRSVKESGLERSRTESELPVVLGR